MELNACRASARCYASGGEGWQRRGLELCRWSLLLLRLLDSQLPKLALSRKGGRSKAHLGPRTGQSELPERRNPWGVKAKADPGQQFTAASSRLGVNAEDNAKTMEAAKSDLLKTQMERRAQLRRLYRMRRAQARASLRNEQRSIDLPCITASIDTLFCQTTGLSAEHLDVSGAAANNMLCNYVLPDWMSTRSYIHYA